MSFSNPSTPSPKSPFLFKTPARTLPDFQFLKRIGSGHSGQVYLALDNRTETLVAVKVIPKSKGLDEWVLGEQDIQASLDDGQITFLHPLLCSWHDTENYYLVTDYLGGNDMAIELGVAGRFNEDRVRFYAAEMVVALEQLRTRKIIHRDIKPGNILFTREGHLRLTDFGLSKKFYSASAQPLSPTVDSRIPFEFVASPDADSGVFILEADETQGMSFTTDESVGTPAFMSVEMHFGRPYSFGADTHALGVLMYRMLTQRLPFGENASTGDEMRDAVINDPLHFSENDDISELTRDFVQKLLVKDPHDLMSLDEIKSHAYFYGVKWDRVSRQTLTPPWKPFIPPLPKAQGACPIKKGDDYDFSDPHPEFQFTSPRMDRPKEVPAGETVRQRFGSLFDSMTGKNVMPPLTPSKTSPRTATKLQSAPSTPTTKILGDPKLVISTISMDPVVAPAEVRKPTWPACHGLPSPSETVFPILHPAPPAPRDHSNSEGTEPISPAASKTTLRGRLPSPTFRRGIRSRPRGPDVLRPLTADVSMISESESGGATLKRDVQAKARRPSSTSMPAKVEVSGGPRKAPVARRSPLREVTNRSDLLKPKSVVGQSPQRNVLRSDGSPAASPKSKSKSQSKSKSKSKRKSKSVSKSESNDKFKLNTQSKPDTLSMSNPQSKAACKFSVPSRGPEIDLSDVEDAAFEPGVYPRPMERAETYEQPALAHAEKIKPADYPRPNIGYEVTTSASESSRPLAPNIIINEGKPPPKPSPPEAATSNESARRAASSNVSIQIVMNTAPDVYPRPMERAQTYNHPALAYARVKSKPADYPRPNIKEKKRKSWHPTIAEAFARPPRTPPKAPGLRRLFLPDSPSSGASTLSSPASSKAGRPLMCKAQLFQTYSATLSDDARHRLYGRPIPPPSLTREEIRAKIDDVVARARHGILERASCGIFPSACRDDGFGTSSGPLLPGPHYQGSLLTAPRTGFLAYLRRYWVRASLACGRLLARVKARFEPLTHSPV